MKPFNLQEALAGKKVVTRDGRAVTNLIHFSNVTDQPVVCAVGGRLCTAWTDGKYSLAGGERDLDLFMAAEVKEAWINVYNAASDGGGMGRADAFSSEALADEWSDRARRLGGKAHRITWEE